MGSIKIAPVTLWTSELDMNASGITVRLLSSDWHVTCIPAESSFCRYSPLELPEIGLQQRNCVIAAKP